MEKKGDLLNQLALIADLIEKCDVVSPNQNVLFEISKVEFEKIYDIITKKTNVTGDMPNTMLNIKIGSVTFIFSTSNA